MPAPTMALARLIDAVAAALELHRVDAGLLDEPDGRGDRLLVADLVGAERQVRDQQRVVDTPRRAALVSTSISSTVTVDGAR